MAAPKSNQYWKLRAKHGREAIFTDPLKMLDACMEYFDVTSKRKWYKKEAVKSGDSAGLIIDVPIETPFSLTGLCMFLGVNTKYFFDFKKSKTYEENKDFSEVVTHVEEIIDTQQFEGAIVGTFNPNIIARKLGLVDKQELNQKIVSDVKVDLSEYEKIKNELKIK